MKTHLHEGNWDFIQLFNRRKEWLVDRRASFMNPAKGILILLGMGMWGSAAVALPSSKEIIAFANNPEPHYSTDDIIYPLPYEKFLEIIDNSKVQKTRPPDEELRYDTIPKYTNLPAWRKESRDLTIEELGGDVWKILLCEGIAATKDEVYFWQLITNHWLELQDSKGEHFYLHETSDNPRAYAKANFPLLQKMPLGSDQKPIRVISFSDQDADQGLVRMMLPLTTMQKYLQNSHIDNWPSGIVSPEIVSLVKNSDPLYEAKVQELKKLYPKNSSSLFFTYDGGFVTPQNAIGFWEIWSPKSITVWNEKDDFWHLRYNQEISR